MSDAENTQETLEVQPHEVLDPEDYNQSTRLKDIHQARRDVRKKLDELTYGHSKRHEETRIQLANAVAAYGMEVQPIMRKTDWSEPLPPELAKHYDSIHRYITEMGRIDRRRDTNNNGMPGERSTSPHERCSMAAFSHLNEFVSQVGLGVELEESQDDVAELNYEDLL